jgi:hypothetical protein
MGHYRLVCMYHHSNKMIDNYQVVVVVVGDMVFVVVGGMVIVL